MKKMKMEEAHDSNKRYRNTTQQETAPKTLHKAKDEKGDWQKQVSDRC